VRRVLFGALRRTPPKPIARFFKQCEDEVVSRELERLEDKVSAWLAEDNATRAKQRRAALRRRPGG
jgi:hypothetical protein